MKKIILSLGISVLSVMALSSTVFAQGDFLCKGNVAGVISGGNTNIGDISFDAHENSGLTSDDLVDLSILGLDRGLAPSEKGNAACTEYIVGKPGYDHVLKGWAWSDNLGFISFSCEGGFNPEGGRNNSGVVGGGVRCGRINYSVKLTTPDVEGNRALKGYAWNSVFGWIQFDNGVFPEHEVKVDADGYTSGYAWTSTGMWMDFSGIRLELYEDEEMYDYAEGDSFFGDPLFPEEPMCNGPACELCEGEDCVACEGPLCQVCEGKDCLGCVGPMCEVCVGEDCVACEGVACEVCEGADCEAVVPDVRKWCKNKDFLCVEINPAPEDLPLGLGVDGPEFDFVDGEWVDRMGDGEWIDGVWVDRMEIDDGSGNGGGDQDRRGGGNSDDRRGGQNGQDRLEIGSDNSDAVALDLTLEASARGDVSYADGVDGYYVHLYLKDADEQSLDPDDFDGITFVWEDTVKSMQSYDGTDGWADGVGDSLRDMNRPWTQSDAVGAVKFKPLSFDDFREMPKDPGHYVSVEPVSSYAPTTGENISFTHSTSPSYPFNNETFIYGVGVPETVEQNRLVLKRIEYGAYDDGEGTQRPAGSVVPNGKIDGVNFRFKPPISVNTLYVGAMEDKINAYRGIPSTAITKASASHNLATKIVNQALFNYSLYYEPDNNVVDAYNRCEQSDFNFHFLAMNGEKLEDDETHVLSLHGRDVVGKDLELQTVATLPVVEVEEGEEASFPCPFAEAPSLFTTVQYWPTAGKPVSYYSNKLPKTPGEISNPSIEVHGNIYGQDIGNVSSKNSVQLVGNPAIDLVRDTIVRNLEKNISSEVPSAGKNKAGKNKVCVVRELSEIEAGRFNRDSATCALGSYKEFTVGDENVLYFKGQDVVIDLSSGEVENRWVVVVDGGNIFMNSSINSEDELDRRITLVALRDSTNLRNYYKTGHGYLTGGKSMVLDATMIFDGSLFPYMEGLDFGDKGSPLWPDAPTKAQALNYQLLVRGAIYSDNTIGGADLDGGDNPKNYLMAGAGEIIELPASSADRLRAQTYDLNYLRMFTMEVETCADGTPKDQACGACLTIEDLGEIARGAILCGERGVCSPRAVREDGSGWWFGGRLPVYACNGINPLVIYDGSGSAEGDLVPPQDHEFVVEVDGSPDPVYIYYRAPAKDSFVFNN